MSGQVKCPECDASLKLKPGLKKARCPRCKTIIDLTALGPKETPKPQSPQKSSPQKKRRPKPPPQEDPWEDDFLDDEDPFEDDDAYEDYEEDDYEEPARPARKPKSKPKKRSRKASSGPMLSEETRQQVMSFGWFLVGLGALSFVLPFIGLQIKGLHALGAEGQMIGGGVLIGFGVFMLVIGALGDIGVSIFGIVKWGLIGFIGLSLASCIGCTGFVQLMAFFKDNKAPAPVAPQNFPNMPAVRPGSPAGEPFLSRAGPRPSYGPSSFQSRMEQQFAQFQPEEILNLELTGFNPSEQRIIMNRIRGTLGARITTGSVESQVYKIRMAPVPGELQAIADQLNFIEIKSVDTTNRLIVGAKR